jgi:dolichyl-phosphate beta-glucosyltransferase
MDNCIIIIPCYNEAERLDTAALWRFVAAGNGPRFLLVNDGSTDDTASVLEGLRRWNPQRFEVCHLPRNMGKAEAVRRGMLRALDSRPDWVGYWDADMATPLEAIADFGDLLRWNPRLQMVIGARVRLLGRSIRRRPLRHCLGRLFATAASLVLGLPVYDTQCGAKLFRVSPRIHALLEQPFCTNWVFDVELLARFVTRLGPGGTRAAEEAIYELPLRQWHDVPGSKVKAGDFVKGLLELLRIYWVYFRPGAAAARPAPVAQSEGGDNIRPRHRAA